MRLSTRIILHIPVFHIFSFIPKNRSLPQNRAPAISSHCEFVRRNCAFSQIPIRPHRWSTRHRPAAERLRRPGTTGSGTWISSLSTKPHSELSFPPQGDGDDLADGAPSVPAALAGAAAADAQRRHGRRGRRPRRGRRRLLQQQLVQRRWRPHETLRGGRQGAGAAAADLHPKQLKASQGMVRVIGEPDCLAVTRWTDQ